MLGFCRRLRWVLYDHRVQFWLCSSFLPAGITIGALAVEDVTPACVNQVGDVSPFETEDARTSFYLLLEPTLYLTTIL